MMHVGHNMKIKYFLNDKGLAVELQEVEEEKDLGVIISKDLSNPPNSV